MALAVSPLSNRQPRHSTVSPMDIDGAAAASGLNISCGTLEILSTSGRVECSPFQKSTHLLAYGSDTHISVVQRFDNVDGPDEHPEKPSKHSPLDRCVSKKLLPVNLTSYLCADGCLAISCLFDMERAWMLLPGLQSLALRLMARILSCALQQLVRINAYDTLKWKSPRQKKFSKLHSTVT